LNKPQFVEQSQLQTKSGWTPFTGQVFPGSVAYTVVKGDVYPAH
jgi:dihydroorotase-like cyclic amidohydrolase